MKIVFADGSLNKLKYLAWSDEIGSGYFKSKRIGKYILITDFISGKINKEPDKNSLLNIYELWGVEWGGLFFKEGEEILTDWFLEKLIISIDETGYKISCIDSNSGDMHIFQSGNFENN